MGRLNVRTRHTHGNYLHYLSHAARDFHVLSKPDRPIGYSGRCAANWNALLQRVCMTAVGAA